MAVDPLELLKAANNPALTQTNVNAQKTANDLTAGLAKLNSQRAGQLQNTNLMGENTLNNTFASQGIDRSSPNALSQLEQFRGLKNANTESNTFNVGSAGAVNLANIGQYMKQQPTAGETVSPSNSTSPGIPLPVRKAKATGSDAAKITATNTQGKKTKSIQSQDGTKIGFNSVEDAVEDKTKIEQKGQLPPEISKGVMDKARLAFPSATSIGEPERLKSGKVVIEVDGQLIPVNGI